jgi:L-threonylcarbamoyladenylate synthase
LIASNRFVLLSKIDNSKTVFSDSMTTDEQIQNAAELLKRGELVAFPTETVYGLGANALDPIAVAKIFELKGRPKFDPLIVHIADPNQLSDLVETVPPLAAELTEKFWPGPLSIVLKKKPCVPDIVTAGLPTVAIRCPQHPVAAKIIRAAGLPISAPSANKFGMVSPTTAAHVADQFGDSLHVVDGGPCKIGVESAVVSFVDSDDGSPRLLRHGGVTQEQIETVTGPIQSKIHEESQPTSPGQLSRHYSPRTRLVIAEGVTAESLCEGADRVGLIRLAPANAADSFVACEVLSQQGCLREAAANLFSVMRRLDEMDLDLIVAEAVPEQDLGRAIMDRLRRAAAK